MKGRQESERNTEALIKKLLEDRPRYLYDYYITLDSKSHTTKLKYLRYIIYLIDYLEDKYDLDLDEVENFKNIKVSMINNYMTSIKYKKDGSEMSNSLKASRFYGIKNFFDFLVDDEYIENNPCSKVKLPRNKDQHKIVSLTKEEINIIKDNINSGVGNQMSINRQRKWRSRDMALIMLALSLGLRVASVSEINLEDIDFENNLLTIVEKGNKIRTLQFSDSIKSLLYDWLKDRECFLKNSNKTCDALFITFQINRMTVGAISDMIKKYTYNIDKHITPHKLRSTCATNIYEKTGDIYLVADVLGHSNLGNTRRYTMVSSDKRKQAASAMDDILF